MFIAFDGIDGAGKSTIASGLKEYFEKNNYIVYEFDMGSCGFVDKFLKEIKNERSKCTPEIRELIYYFEGNMLSQKIKLINNDNTIILIDRYILTYYANGVNNGINIEDINNLTQYMIWPDFYFYLSISPEESLKRIEKYRKIDLPEIGYANNLSENEEENKVAFIKNQSKVINNYKHIINKYSDRITILDALKSKKSLIEEVVKKINNRKEGV